MAAPWIKFDTTTPDKPEIVRMAAILKIDQDAVVGKLLRLWSWADINSVDGNGITVTCAFLDRVAFCPGFAEAMRSVGWLAGKDGDLSVPNFERHNGKTAKGRALTNRRVSDSRERNAVVAGNVTLTPLRNALPEEEEEVEEEKEQKQDQKQSAYADSSTSAGAAVDADPAADAEGDKARADHRTGDLLGDQQQAKQRRKEIPQCPHDEIIALYHEKLPTLRQVRTWAGERPKTLRSRWREDPERQCLEWWAGYFDHVAQSDFLMGRKKDFSADLEWLIAPRNFAKVIEGRYDNDRFDGGLA